MSYVLTYSFLGWGQFLMILLLCVIVLAVGDRFHLFRRHQWSTSIGYHMFFIVVVLVVLVAFVAVRPLIHTLLLIVVFGFFYKNFISYVRSVFSLYYSSIQIGDMISIDDTDGRLVSINVGGMTISEENQQSFLPFHSWRGKKIVLRSQGGKVSHLYKLRDEKDRSIEEVIQIIENELFKFPYLSSESIDLTASNEDIAIRLTLESKTYIESLKTVFKNKGFTIM